MCVNKRLIFKLLDSELWDDDFSSMVDLVISKITFQS